MKGFGWANSVQGNSRSARRNKVSLAFISARSRVSASVDVCAEFGVASLQEGLALLMSSKFRNRDPLHSAADFPALEVADAHADLIQAGRQPGVKLIDGLTTLCRR